MKVCDYVYDLFAHLSFADTVKHQLINQSTIQPWSQLVETPKEESNIFSKLNVCYFSIQIILNISYYYHSPPGCQYFNNTFNTDYTIF